MVSVAFGESPRPDPDPRLTPGKVRVTDARVVCMRGYAAKARRVTAEALKEAWKRYGYDRPAAGDWELDHLIPLELGGSNDADNLWPQPAEPVPGYHEKDWVENVLHQLVCSHLLSLRTAQARVRDWVAIWIILQENPGNIGMRLGGS